MYIYIYNTTISTNNIVCMFRDNPFNVTLNVTPLKYNLAPIDDITF